MQSLLSVATILAIVAWTEGLLVIELPGLQAPTINRGLEE